MSISLNTSCPWEGQSGLGVGTMSFVHPGTLVLLAVPDVPAAAPAAPLSAAAVEPLNSAEDSLVRSVEKALQIESVQALEQRAALIREGLAGNLEFLTDYCHYAAGRLKRIPRKETVELELALLKNGASPIPNRIAAQVNLEIELRKADDPEDPFNKRILETFFNALEVPNEELGRTLVQSIYRILVSNAPPGTEEGTSYRMKLTMGIKLLPKDSLLASLHELEKNPNIAAEAAWIREFISGL